VTYCSVSPQAGLEDLLVPKYIGNKPDSPVGIESDSSLLSEKLACNDPRRFLAAVLQGMQAVVRHDRCFRMAVDSKDPAMAAGLSFQLIQRIHIPTYEKIVG